MMKPSFSILLPLLALTVFCSLSNGPPISNEQIENLKGDTDSSVITLVDTVRLKGHIIKTVWFFRSLRIYFRKPIDNLGQKKKVLPLIYLDSTFRSKLDTTYLSGNNKAYFMERDDFTGLLKMSLYYLPNDSIDAIYKTYAKPLYESLAPDLEFKSKVVKKGLKKYVIWESDHLDQTFFIFRVPNFVLTKLYPEYVVPSDLIRGDGTVLVVVNR